MLMLMGWPTISDLNGFLECTIRKRADNFCHRLHARTILICNSEVESGGGVHANLLGLCQTLSGRSARSLDARRGRFNFRSASYGRSPGVTRFDWERVAA